MSDVQPTTPTEPQQPATTPAQPPADPKTQNQTIPYDRFNKVIGERNALKERIEAIEAAQKQATETQLAEEKRFEELANKYKAELEQERTSRLRLQVATAAGLPVQFADRLQGDNLEALQADATALAAFLKPATPGVPQLPSSNTPPQGGPTPEQLADPEWVRKNSGAVLKM